jgi:hypothetical protein
MQLVDWQLIVKHTRGSATRITANRVQTMTSPYYCPSGRLPPTAIPFTILGSIAALPGAWIYAWLTVHIPFVYFNFFFTTCFAICLGCIAKYAATHGKVRNPRWMGKLGVAIGLVGWYCQWAAWIAMLIHKSGHLSGDSLVPSFIALAASPRFMVHFAVDVASTGVWKIGGWSVAGGALIAVWLAELALLLYLPHLMGRTRAGEPFCETSNTWAEATELPRKFAFIDEPYVVAQFLETHPKQLFSVLGAWSEGGPLGYSKVTVHHCRGGGDPYISITNTAVVLKDGKIEETHKSVSDFLRLPGMDPDEVMRICAASAPSPSEAAGVPELPDPPGLETAIEYLNAGQYEAALDSAAPYIKADQASLRIDATRLCALACSRLGRWPESTNFWHTLFDEERTAHNALQVATSSVMAGNVQRGATWVAKSLEMNAVSHELPGLLIQTNFVTALSQCGQMKDALPYLDEIKQVYANVRLTDPTFLYAQRMPLFSAFLDNSAPVIRAALDPEQGRAWYTSMLPHLDDSGRTELSAWLANDFIHTTGQPGAA